jgi:hypothetical protein
MEPSVRSNQLSPGGRTFPGPGGVFSEDLHVLLGDTSEQFFQAIAPPLTACRTQDNSVLGDHYAQILTDTGIQLPQHFRRERNYRRTALLANLCDQHGETSINIINA